jgi:hypothetical protein
MMAKGKGDEYRHRLAPETITRAQSATPAEALGIMLEFWGAFAQWAARHGINIKTAAEIFNRGIGCPVHKLPWIWAPKGDELRCPHWPECGIVVTDRNAPSPEVSSILAEMRREERTQMHMPSKTPARIKKKEDELREERKAGRVNG